MATADLLIFFALYALSHLVRVARLLVALVLDRPRVSSLGLAHFLGAFASAILPFKSGEILRAVLIMKAANKRRAGLSAFLVEKVLDASTLLLLLAFVSFHHASSIPVALIAVLLTAIFGFMVARAIHLGASQAIRHEFVSASSTQRSLLALRILAEIDFAYQGVRHVIAGRLIVMILLTGAIWALDFAAFNALVAGTSSASLTAFLDALDNTLSLTMASYLGNDYLRCGLLVIATFALTLIIYKLFSKPKAMQKGAPPSRSGGIKEYKADPES